MLPLWLRRLYWRRRLNASSPLSVVWQQSTVTASRSWREQEFLVVDLEMSALNPDEGEILSIGWVEISNGAIRLCSAEHLLVAKHKTVGESAAVHQLRDCELEQGLQAGEMLQLFLQAAAGKVLVFHHSPLDVAYLNALCRKVYGAPLLLPVVDTLALEKRKRHQQNLPLEKGALTLSGCRGRYSLPNYPAHNALQDAIATAELLLAHIGYRGKHVTVGELLAS